MNTKLNKKLNKKKSAQKNQRGMVIVEFIFALVITASLTILLFSVTYTLLVTSVTQYVAFSVARAYSNGGESPESQAQRARDKFASLTTDGRAVASLYRNGWFEISSPNSLDIRGGLSSDNRRLFDQDFDRSFGSQTARAQGVSVRLAANILRSRLPLLGATDPDDEPNNFVTFVNALLIRDPSQSECREFMEARRRALADLPSGRRWSQAIGRDYIPMEDNGC
jgi:hypothetical protein